LLADADLIHYTKGGSQKDEEEAIRKASDSSSTVRTLPDDKFSKNAGIFMRVNRPISKCSAKF
jgi:hypothetical protein